MRCFGQYGIQGTERSSGCERAGKKKVQEAARKFHYVPNNSARDLVRPKSDAVGLIVRGAGNPFFTSLINTIEKDLSTEG